MTDDKPLHVDMSGKHGEPLDVALLLEASAEIMREMPDDARYDFELSVTEVTDCDNC